FFKSAAEVIAVAVSTFKSLLTEFAPKATEIFFIDVSWQFGRVQSHQILFDRSNLLCNETEIRRILAQLSFNLGFDRSSACLYFVLTASEIHPFLNKGQKVWRGLDGPHVRT